MVKEDKKSTKSNVLEEKYIHRLLDNKPCDTIDISDDNEEIDDVEFDVVSDVKIIEVLQNEVHMNEYGVEEKVKVNDVKMNK